MHGNSYKHGHLENETPYNYIATIRMLWRVQFFTPKIKDTYISLKAF